MKYEVAKPEYTHPDEKQRMTPRDRAICEHEFNKWLKMQAHLSRWSESAQAAIAEVIRMYNLSQAGLLGVTCFCGRLASGLGYVPSGRNTDAVGLCQTHLQEYRQAEEVRTALSNAVYERHNPKQGK